MTVVLAITLFFVAFFGLTIIAALVNGIDTDERRAAAIFAALMFSATFSLASYLLLKIIGF